LIAYCLGNNTKYKIDVPQLNHQIMNLFTKEDQEKEEHIAKNIMRDVDGL
jgi:hypothetical protein